MLLYALDLSAWAFPLVTMYKRKVFQKQDIKLALKGSETNEINNQLDSPRRRLIYHTGIRSHFYYRYCRELTPALNESRIQSRKMKLET